MQIEGAMNTGTYIVIAVVLLASLFGFMRIRTDGTVRSHAPGSYVTPEELGHDMGKKATFVQFSSPFCQPCKATHEMVVNLIDGNNEVTHVDLQVADHLDLVNQLHIMRTPTTVLLDGNGHIEYRVEGAPRAPELAEALSKVLHS
jgi:protein-disulfide isomerase